MPVGRRAVLVGLGTVMAAPDARAQTDTLRVVAPWEYSSDDPADTGYILTRMGVAETLVGVRPDGALEGLVAEHWAVDPDQLTWRFRLRPGLTFHDGAAVSAEVVAQGLRAAFRGESLSNVPLDGVTAEGGQVVVRTTRPFSPLPAFLVDFAAAVLSPGAPGRPPAGTGPYRIVGQAGRTGFEAERFGGYRGMQARIARVRYAAVPNGDTRANIAVAGDADLVFTLAPQAIPRINAAGRMAVRSVTIPRLRFLTLNVGLPQFADVRVRQALSLAIDRGAIAAGILRHPASAATQLFPPVLSAWHDPALPPLRTDVPAARAMLDDAGWRAGPDGIRAKDGVRLEARVMTSATRPELPVIATALQAQFRAVGMALGIDVGATAALPQAVQDGTMQMGLIARTLVNVPDPIGTIIPDYTRARSVWGTMDWPGRVRMQALTDEYVASFDPARQAVLRHGIAELLHREMPVIPVSWFEHTAAVSTRLVGVEIDPFEMRYLPERAGFA